MRSIERIIESQLERWAVERRAQEEAAHRPQAAPPGARRRPWVSMSRDFGAGGSEIAALLAARLGYELFDRRLLDALAQESRYRLEFLASLDEKKRSVVEAHVDALLHGASFLRSDFLRTLMRVVMTIGEHGHAVIVGRGASLILPREGGLAVRIVAPFERRAEAIAARQSLTLEEARLQVRDVDRARADFLRTHFHLDGWRAEDHDLTIDTRGIAPESAVRIVECALTTRFPEEDGSQRRAG